MPWTFRVWVRSTWVQYLYTHVHGSISHNSQCIRLVLICKEQKRLADLSMLSQWKRRGQWGLGSSGNMKVVFSNWTWNSVPTGETQKEHHPFPAKIGPGRPSGPVVLKNKDFLPFLGTSWAGIGLREVPEPLPKGVPAASGVPPGHWAMWAARFSSTRNPGSRGLCGQGGAIVVRVLGGCRFEFSLNLKWGWN